MSMYLRCGWMRMGLGFLGLTMTVAAGASAAWAAEDDSAVVIGKVPGLDVRNPDFEVVTGAGDIVGDPQAGYKESFAAWKRACAEWKKEVREGNPGQVLNLNCGSPTREEAPGQQLVLKSRGTYKVRVRIRDSGKGQP